MSKKPKDDLIYIDHILEHIALLETLTESDFKDKLITLSVERCIEIIGEACNQLSQKFKESHSHIPWRDIVDMRNFLIHGYFAVDYHKLLKTAQEDIPLLKKQLLDILSKLKTET